MRLSKQDQPALILIDIQKGFDELEYWGGERNNPQAEHNAGQLLHFWRQQGLPLFHVKHCSTNPHAPLALGNRGNEFKEEVCPLPGELIISKTVNSAFIGTDLLGLLNQQEIKKVVIAGLTTDHCVSTTTRMAGNFGFETYLVADASATFRRKGIAGQEYPAELVHETALASLDGEFATVVNTHEVMACLR
ncbi:MAG TPA: cysteine hydrolase family protein [Flavisolibacter sp.]|nr:cysteine hydrolase family protein [Flavisolibacter sp.]